MAEKLAIDGGRPVRAALLPYGRQSVGEDDIEAVVAVLRSDWLTTGPLVDVFERAVASAAGAAHAVALSSGTAALHAAVSAAGIGPGHEVIVPPLTFVASSNAALYCGAVPVFADVRSDTLTLDLVAAEAQITPRTRALLPVDFAGQPCDADAIGALARARGLTVIRDAAHSLGAEHGGRRVGAFADLSVFSFHPAKVVTAGEGGAVATDCEDLAERLRSFRNHGFGTDFRARQAHGDVYSPMTALGYNYRLTDIQCALALSQLSKLDEFLKRRAQVALRYMAALADVPAVRVPTVDPAVKHGWHIFPVLLDLERLSAGRRTIFAALRAENIGVAVHYVPAYWHPYYESLGYRRGLCPRAEAAYERLLTLPLFPAMADRDVDDVLAALAKVLRHFAR